MKAWRESASLILAARHGQKYNRTVSPAVFNYNVLCLKRHQNSGFMPGSYVFPGGVVDPADCDLKWREFFATFGIDSFASLVPKAAVRPQILMPRQNELPREISLRIAAIRETFEECGVLVCRRKEDAPSAWARHVSVPKNELRTWQSKIHDDAAEFLTLCEKLECYPDLWALYEWSNWLTPTFMKRRYDTIFYLACVATVPRAEYESSEMEDLKWETPEYFLSSSADITLPVPQRYEFTRLTELKDIDNLLDLATERNKAGVQLFLPIGVHLKDGVVSVLPGDTMYPKEVSLTDKRIIDRSDITIDEFREITPVKNRVEFHDTQQKVVYSDIGPTLQESGEPHIKHKL